MQARAIFEAAVRCPKTQMCRSAEYSPSVRPVTTCCASHRRRRRRGVSGNRHGSAVPRGRDDRTAACRLACRWDRERAEFFFGTNDLTQTTFGLSRDDTAGLLKEYERRGIFETDPFVSIDIDGVGELVKLAERGRETRLGSLGICGEHGIIQHRSISAQMSVSTMFRVPPQGADCAPGCHRGAEIERLEKESFSLFPFAVEAAARRSGSALRLDPVCFLGCDANTLH